VSFIWAVGVEIVDDIDSNSNSGIGVTDLMEYEIARGRYAQIYSDFEWAYAKYDTKVEDIEPYKEFCDFYENYIMYNQYSAYIENVNEGKDIEEKRKCLEKMEKISNDTTYDDIKPHYEYLLEELNY
jgi:hypothetical protein